MTPLNMRALALDVDGVLTDGGTWWGPRGQEWKRFHFTDIMGVSLAIKAGLTITLISGEDSLLIDRFAKKVGITQVAKGCTDKAAALRAFALSNHIGLGDVGFMGDDVNDMEAILLAGWSAAPADAHRVIRARVNFVTRRSGGNGAVREAIDHLMSARQMSLPAALPAHVG